jgi:hypothetical protein
MQLRSLSDEEAAMFESAGRDDRRLRMIGRRAFFLTSGAGGSVEVLTLP